MHAHQLNHHNYHVQELWLPCQQQRRICVLLLYIYIYIYIYGTRNIIVEAKTQNEDVCIISSDNYSIVASICCMKACKSVWVSVSSCVDVSSETFSHCNLVILKQVSSQITYNTLSSSFSLCFGTFHFKNF